MPRPPLLAPGVRARRPKPPGPRFASAVTCEACGHGWTARYASPPERFPCPRCRRRAGLRDLPDDDNATPAGDPR